jgi:hypothetical protein
MPHKVRTEVANVTLPGVGRIDTAQTTVTLTDMDFSLIPSAAFTSGKVTDLGYTGAAGDTVGTQAAFVAQVGALTSSAPTALTSSQNATATATDLATAQALANALKTSYNAAQVDIAALRTTLAAVQVDVATLRTALNSELTALQGVGRPQAAS